MLVSRSISELEQEYHRKLQSASPTEQDRQKIELNRHDEIKRIKENPLERWRRLDWALQDVVKRDLPHDEYVTWAKRIVLLAAIMSYPNSFSETLSIGEFTSWPWKSSGWLLANEPDNYLHGREVFLFPSGQTHTERKLAAIPVGGIPLADFSNGRMKMSTFANLVSRAVVALSGIGSSLPPESGGDREGGKPEAMFGPASDSAVPSLGMVRKTVAGLHPRRAREVAELIAHLSKAAAGKGLVQRADSDKAVADAVHRYLITDHGMTADLADQMSLADAIGKVSLPGEDSGGGGVPTVDGRALTEAAANGVSPNFGQKGGKSRNMPPTLVLTPAEKVSATKIEEQLRKTGHPLKGDDLIKQALGKVKTPAHADLLSRLAGGERLLSKKHLHGHRGYALPEWFQIK